VAEVAEEIPRVSVSFRGQSEPCPERTAPASPGPNS